MKAMRRHAFGIAALACIAAVGLTGCTKKTTVTSPHGSVTVQQGIGGQTTTVKTDTGQVTVGKGAVDAGALGLPVYPGATQTDGGVAAQQPAGGGGTEVTSYETTDSFAQVYGYYRMHMPAGSEKVKMQSGSSAMAQFQVGDEGSSEQKHVTIAAGNGKTTISLMRVTHQ